MKNKNVWIVFKCIFELKIISKKFTIKLKDEKKKWYPENEHWVNQHHEQ